MEAHRPTAEAACARLIVICGCMFSGKTSRLIERLAEARGAGRRIAAFKHRIDTRYDEARLATHDGRSFPACAAGSPDEIAASIGAAQVIGIDEVHFFGRVLLPLCERLVREGRTLILAGIDHDAWGQPFPPLPELGQLAHERELLHAPCAACGRPARFSQRLTPVRGGRMVGGPDDYEPRCGQCFRPLPGPAPVYA